MQRSDPFRILLVDDDDAIRRLARSYLEREHDFQVVAEAGDGVTALQQAATHRPDLILLDVEMPVLDGLSALPSLCAAAPSATVVVLSGSGALDHAAIRSLGAAAVLRKDGEWASLGRSLRALVQADGRPSGDGQPRLAVRLAGRDSIGLWRCAVCAVPHDAADSWVLVDQAQGEGRVACPSCAGASQAS